jgi:gliding motility-associated lipoprotein GldH
MKSTLRILGFSLPATALLKAGLLAVSLVFIITGCMPAPHYQKEEAIPQNAWTYNFKPAFNVEITDTNANYQAFFLIRHTQAYPYSNLWIWIYVKTPGDSVMKKERINIPLAETTGKWLGRGMGEIYEQRMPINLADFVSFNKKGTYKITMEQNMRINPLPEILDVGLRIEKTTPRMQ